MKIKYSDKFISIQINAINGSEILFDDWLDHLDNPAIFNIINDLIVNGTASLKDNTIVTILYEDLNQLDDFEYSTLKLPEPYPFDIFIDIIGSGLKDLNLKLKYSFQDFAHGNGSGNILFNKEHKIGGYLKNKSEYLLNSNQFKLIEALESINSTKFTNSNDVLKSIAKIQGLAANAKAVLSKILIDTEIISPGKIKIEFEEVAKDKFRLKPIIEKIDNEKFQKNIQNISKSKPEYNFKENTKKIRVIIDENTNESGNSVATELSKLKKKNLFSSDEINEIYNSPTNFGILI